MKKTLFLLMFLFSSFVLACGDTEETVVPTAVTEETSIVEPISVGVTTSIIQDWVENVGKDRVVVKSIVPSGANPHDFQPGAKDVADLVDSDILFAIGLNYEEYWLDEIINENPQLKSIRLGDSITTIPSYTPDHDDHKGHDDHEGHDDHDEHDEDKGHDDHEGHDDHDEHDKDKGHDDHEGHDDHDEHDDHEGHDDHGHKLSTEDPHYWFDPLRVISLVELIASELSEVDPEGAEYYQSESNKYIAEIIDMDNYALSELKKVTDAGKGILSDHSALAYLSDRYSVKLYAPIISNPHAHGEASPAEIARAIENVRENNISVIFSGEENKAQYGETIAAETNAVVSDKPLRIESLAPGQSYIEFMRYNVDVIVSNLMK